MTLNQYLKEKSITAAAFAERAGLTEATISRIRRGLNRPDWPSMDRIREVTGGDVMPNDFAG